MLVKWRLLVTTLPIVAAVAALRAALDLVLEFPGVVEFGDVALVLTGGVFLVGLMLSGTMADFKESEKLPAELACTLETMEEAMVAAAQGRATLDARALRTQVATVADSIQAWLLKRQTPAELYATLTQLSRTAMELEKAGAAGYASRVLAELHNLRKGVSRISVISRTSFLQSGYALLETLVVLIVALMLGSRFKSVTAEYLLISFVTLIFVYMVRLIRDLDDPFEYGPQGERGAADVDLFPLAEYRQRLEERLRG